MVTQGKTAGERSDQYERSRMENQGKGGKNGMDEMKEWQKWMARNKRSEGTR